MQYVIIDEIHELAGQQAGRPAHCCARTARSVCRGVPAHRALGNSRESRRRSHGSSAGPARVPLSRSRSQNSWRSPSVLSAIISTHQAEVLAKAAEARRFDARLCQHPGHCRSARPCPLRARAMWRCTTARSQRKSGSMPRSGSRKARSGPSSAPPRWSSGSISGGSTT